MNSFCPQDNLRWFWSQHLACQYQPTFWRKPNLKFDFRVSIQNSKQLWICRNRDPDLPRLRLKLDYRLFFDWIFGEKDTLGVRANHRSGTGFVSYYQPDRMIESRGNAV
tara:strand:- start:72 stop:398 length:327 start_codon:yes stop_codon:yes gene_type:complete